MAGMGAAALRSCGEENRSALKALAVTGRVTLWAGNVELGFGMAELCAELVTGRGSIYWAERSARASIPSVRWATSADRELFRGLPRNPLVMRLEGV